MKEKKINDIVNQFFDSLKSYENPKLQTGLTQHETIDLLKNATIIAIEENPRKFEVYVNWILSSAMYLLDESDESEDIEEQVSEQQSPSQLDFNFIAYDQDIVITGAKGSGKSYLANVILKSLNGITVMVYDYNFQFHSSRAIIVHTLDDMFELYDQAGHGHFIFQPFDNSLETFKKFCSGIFKRGNIVSIMDEAHSFCSKQARLKEFDNIILSGRPRGISAITISTRPASLPNNVLTNAKHVFAFRLNLESDARYLESWMGSAVWQLFPKDKRVKMKDAPELEPYSFYYRNMDEQNGVISRV